jgi:hypothetical protein
LGQILLISAATQFFTKRNTILIRNYQNSNQ